MIEAVRAEAYRIPTPEPAADGTLTWDATTMVVARVRWRTPRVLAGPTPTPAAST
jgi:hypothetical protein